MSNIITGYDLYDKSRQTESPLKTRKSFFYTLHRIDCRIYVFTSFHHFDFSYTDGALILGLLTL